MLFAADCILAPTTPPTCAPRKSPHVVSGIIMSFDVMADGDLLVPGDRG